MMECGSMVGDPQIFATFSEKLGNVFQKNKKVSKLASETQGLIYNNNEGQERKKPSFPEPGIYYSKSWGYCVLRLHGRYDRAYVSGKITYWLVFGSFLFSIRHEDR